MLELMDVIAIAKRKWTDWIHDVEQEMVDLFAQRDGDLTFGNVRYYLGRDKRYKRRVENQQIIDAVSMAMMKQNLSGTTADYLASQPWKPGAMTRLLGKDRFDELFETTVVERISLKKTRSE